jgi:hypothetical protein
MKPNYQVPITLTKGSEVLHFDNCKLCAEHFEINRSNISRALNNNKTYKGYTIERNMI